MEERIKATLLEIEREEGVQIFYACESGSRAWGFPSVDSDYDVRFLYLRPRDWYLSVDVDTKRDVIERPIIDELDVSGWDIRKALMLLRKSNPPLLEWLDSPIVYQDKFGIIDRIRKLIPEFYSPTASLHHYLHMAQGNYREYLKGDTVWVKKYFYVLRPILAIKWIEATNDVAPMRFEILVERVIDDSELKTVINDLVENKKNGCELNRGPKIPQFDQFISKELNRLEKRAFEREEMTLDTKRLNEVFRQSLIDAWEPKAGMK